MRTLPPESVLYEAVVRKDSSFEGVFVVAVRTTGVFCRPGCGAKTPKRENVEFFAAAQQALHAGYRPCRRCKPLETSPAGEPEAWVAKLAQRVDQQPGERISSASLRAMGIDPARAARRFKTHFGMTFQAYCRARRMGLALQGLRKGLRMTKAMSESGFASESGFRDAFSKLFGATPGAARRIGGSSRAPAGEPEALVARWLESPLGAMLAVASERGLCLLEFVDRRALATQVNVLRRRFGCVVVPEQAEEPHAVLEQAADELAEYFAGARREFTVPILAPGTPFQERVWAELRRIPAGQTRSYLQIARALGQPTATRAVARANGDNRLSVIIPCHRVIGADGSLTGYGGGLWRKQRLLDLERGGAEAGLFGRSATPSQA